MCTTAHVALSTCPGVCLLFKIKWKVDLSRGRGHTRDWGEREGRKRVKVGKYNALSGNTASAPSQPSIWQRVVLYPHSRFGLVARLGGHRGGSDIRLSVPIT